METGSKTRRQLSPLRIFAAPIFAQSSRSISFLTAAPRALTLAESSCQSSLCSSLLGAIPGALQGRALPFISACRLRGARCVCRAMQGRVARRGASRRGASQHGSARLPGKGEEQPACVGGGRVAGRLQGEGGVARRERDWERLCEKQAGERAAGLLAAGSGWARWVRGLNTAQGVKGAKVGSDHSCERVRVQPGCCCYSWD